MIIHDHELRPKKGLGSLSHVYVSHSKQIVNIYQLQIKLIITNNKTDENDIINYKSNYKNIYTRWRCKTKDNNHMSIETSLIYVFVIKTTCLEGKYRLISM